MKKINLTNEKSNTVHVDDVKVEDGIYACDNKDEGLYFIGTDCNGFVKRFPDGKESAYTWQSIKELIADHSSTNFYHIPTGKQITAEKELTVDDLTNDMHVGFIISGLKWYVLYDGEGMNAATLTNSHYAIGKTPNRIWGYKKSTRLLIEDMHGNDKISELYTFDTRKELYKWLSE